MSSQKAEAALLERLSVQLRLRGARPCSGTTLKSGKGSVTRHGTDVHINVNLIDTKNLRQIGTAMSMIARAIERRFKSRRELFKIFGSNSRKSDYWTN